jgi:hypothetical protein
VIDWTVLRNFTVAAVSAPLEFEDVEAVPLRPLLPN